MTKTSLPSICPKCKAGKAALYHNRRALECGTWVEETSCLLCGYLKSAPFFPVAPRVNDKRPVDRPSPAAIHKEICTLDGCDGLYAPGNSKHRLCPNCANKMQRWRFANKGNPAPLIKQGDGWILNPERKGAA